MDAVVVAFVVLVFIAVAVTLHWGVNRLFPRTWGGGQGRDVIKDLRTAPRTKSEKQVIDYLEKHTGRKFPTVNPGWLVIRGKARELDGYNRELKLALEFSGPLHTKWYPAKELYTKYYERLIVDAAKKQVCGRNGVGLIVVDITTPRHHWENYVKSRLLDMGFLQQESVGVYLPEHSAIPYRNEHMERELGMDWDRDLAAAT